MPKQVFVETPFKREYVNEWKPCYEYDSHWLLMHGSQGSIFEVHRQNVGVDKTKGRCAVVFLWECRSCGSQRLRYEVEYETFTQSGRWYRGLIPEDKQQNVTGSNVVFMLEQLDWYVYGGSYFGTAGRHGSRPLYVGL